MLYSLTASAYQPSHMQLHLLVVVFTIFGLSSFYLGPNQEFVLQTLQRARDGLAASNTAGPTGVVSLIALHRYHTYFARRKI